MTVTWQCLRITSISIIIFSFVFRRRSYCTISKLVCNCLEFEFSAQSPFSASRSFKYLSRALEFFIEPRDNPVRLMMTVKVYLLERWHWKNDLKRPKLIQTLFLQKLVQGPLGFVPHDERCYKGNYGKCIRSNLQ